APRVDKEWQDIKDAITQPQNSSQPVYKPGRKRADVFSLFIKIAALILIISSAGFSFYLYKQNEEVQQEIAVQEIKTAYGEKKTIHLSDGSTIVLAADSYLSFEENWLSQPVKELYLEGEAFFSIVPEKSK